MSEPIDAATFRLAMQQLAASVTIVSTDTINPAGMTATAVMSISASPPSIVVSINRSSSFHARLNRHCRLCINVLASNQEAICKAFGGGLPAQARFDVGRWARDDPRAPYLIDAVANIFFEVDAMIDYATHTLAVGPVTGLKFNLDREPLLYLRGGFYGLQTRREVWGIPF